MVAARLALRFGVLGLVVSGGLLILALALGARNTSTSTVIGWLCLELCPTDVSPGETNSAAILAALDSVALPYTHDDEYGTLSFTIPGAGGYDAIGGANFDEQERVHMFRVINGDTPTTFWRMGDLFITFGKPDRVFRTCDGIFPARLMLIYGEGNGTIAEVLVHRGLSPETPITYIERALPYARSEFDLRASFGCAVEVTWQGFAPVWVYGQ